MPTCSHPWWALMLALGVTAAQAQAPAPAASAAVAARPGPALRTPEEKRDSATVPGDLRPEDRVVPQLTLTLGRTPPPPVVGASGAGKRARAKANGGIDDAVARCAARETAQERADCRAAIRRPAPAP